MPSNRQPMKSSNASYLQRMNKLTNKQQRGKRASLTRNRGGVLPSTRRDKSFPAPDALMRSGTAVMERRLPLFPALYKANLRYSTALTLNSASGAVASYVFSANGLFDPDITSTGHQPAGFDQMMLSYEHYTVSGARISATFHNVTTAVAAPRCAIALASSPTPITVIDQIIEDGLVVIDNLSPSGQFGSIKTLESAIDIGRFGGVDDLLDNPYYRGDVSNNPTEQQYFHIQLWCTEFISTVSGVEVIIEYEAWFKEPRRLSESLNKILKSAIISEKKTQK